MVNGKIEAYIGFCIKSGKISLGSGAISTLRGGVYLIIADGTAAKNSKRLALKFKNRLRQCATKIWQKQFCRQMTATTNYIAEAVIFKYGKKVREY